MYKGAGAIHDHWTDHDHWTSRLKMSNKDTKKLQLLHDTAVVLMCILKQTLKPEWVVQGIWAAQYNFWLLVKLMPKGGLFSCLSCAG